MPPVPHPGALNAPHRAHPPAARAADASSTARTSRMVKRDVQPPASRWGSGGLSGPCSRLDTVRKRLRDREELPAGVHAAGEPRDCSPLDIGFHRARLLARHAACVPGSGKCGDQGRPVRQVRTRLLPARARTAAPRSAASRLCPLWRPTWLAEACPLAGCCTWSWRALAAIKHFVAASTVSVRALPPRALCTAAALEPPPATCLGCHAACPLSLRHSYSKQHQPGPLLSLSASPPLPAPMPDGRDRPAQNVQHSSPPAQPVAGGGVEVGARQPAAAPAAAAYHAGGGGGVAVTSPAAPRHRVQDIVDRSSYLGATDATGAAPAHGGGAGMVPLAAPPAPPATGPVHQVRCCVRRGTPA